MSARNLGMMAGLGVMCLTLVASPALAVDCPRNGTLIAGAENYRPYQIVEGNDVSGLDFDVIEAVLSRLGCKLEVRVLPWARHLKGIEGGKVDIASSASKTDERSEYAHFSSPYIDAQELLFVPTGETDSYASLAAFFEKGQVLGTIREYAYAGSFFELQKAYPDQIDETGSLEVNLKKLAAGRIHGTIGDVYVVSGGIKALGLADKVAVTEVVTSSAPSFIMFSKKSVPEAFVEAFTVELDKMKAAGEIDAIAVNYR